MSKFEKINKTAMKITKEHSTIVEISSLLKAKEEMINAIKDTEKKVEEFKKRLAVIDEALAEAKKLGMDITLKPEPRSPRK